jgi:hypothetical protein
MPVLLDVAAAPVEFGAEDLPVTLIHYEAYCLESDARRRERFLRTTEGKR